MASMTATRERVTLVFSEEADYSVRRGMVESATPAEIGQRMALSADVRPVETYRLITGGRPGAMVYVD